MKNNSKYISAVLITLNAVDTIRPCIEALKKVCDEVIVLDSDSTDGTVEICKELNVDIRSQKWLGYSQTKNLGNKLAKNDWILSIDSDEVLSDELIKNINELNPKNGEVYSLDRLTNYCGKWIYHCGWYPEWKIRLFNKNDVKWQGDFVHETLSIPKEFQIKKLKGKLFHYSYKDSNDHLKRLKKYAKLSAQDRFKKGKKASFVKRYLAPIARFFRTYFIKKGILDGKEGFIISKRSAYMVWLRYDILNNLWKEKN